MTASFGLMEIIVVEPIDNETCSSWSRRESVNFERKIDGRDASVAVVQSNTARTHNVADTVRHYYRYLPLETAIDRTRAVDHGAAVAFAHCCVLIPWLQLIYTRHERHHWHGLIQILLTADQSINHGQLVFFLRSWRVGSSSVDATDNCNRCFRRQCRSRTARPTDWRLIRLVVLRVYGSAATVLVFPQEEFT